MGTTSTLQKRLPPSDVTDSIETTPRTGKQLLMQIHKDLPVHLASVEEMLATDPTTYWLGAIQVNALLTPALAAYFLQHNDTNRSLRPWLAQQYGQDIRMNAFPYVGDAINLFRFMDGAIILLNGQHRCTGVIDTQRAIPVNIVMHTGPPALAHALYAKIDQGTGRTLPDILKGTFLSALGENDHQPAAELFADFTAMNLRMGLGGVMFLDFYLAHGENAFRRITVSQKLDVAAQYGNDVAFGAWLGKYFKTKARGRILAAGVIAAAIAAYRVSPDDARIFFRSVCAPDMLSAIDPAMALYKAIMSNAYTDKRTLAKSLNYYNATVYCWNRYVEGRDCKRINLSPGQTVKPYVERKTFRLAA